MADRTLEELRQALRDAEAAIAAHRKGVYLRSEYEGGEPVERPGRAADLAWHDESDRLGKALDEAAERLRRYEAGEGQ